MFPRIQNKVGIIVAAMNLYLEGLSALKNSETDKSQFIEVMVTI